MSQPITVNQLLPGHTSVDTAYVVHDYPYGFRLRCTIRYWLDYAPKRGVRLCSQTSNPKKPGLIWNKPKASTYCRFGGAMYLDEDNHVQWTGCHEYMDAGEIRAWLEQFGAANHPECQAKSAKWLEAKIAYEEARTKGLSMTDAAVEAARATSSKPD